MTIWRIEQTRGIAAIEATEVAALYKSHTWAEQLIFQLL